MSFNHIENSKLEQKMMNLNKFNATSFKVVPLVLDAVLIKWLLFLLLLIDCVDVQTTSVAGHTYLNDMYLTF